MLQLPRRRPTSKPQLDGRSGATLDAARCQQRHPGAVGAEPRPARAAQRQHASRPARTQRRPSGVAKRSAPSASQPSQRWRMWKCTPAPRSRCSQARSSGAAFRSVGNTRPELPTKVSMPSPCAQARSACGSKRVEQRRQLRRCARRSARRNGVERFRMGEVHAALAGQQELAADRGHGVVQLDLRRRPRPAPRPPSGRPGRRR